MRNDFNSMRGEKDTSPNKIKRFEYFIACRDAVCNMVLLYGRCISDIQIDKDSYL